jgi:hypothetical protein
MHASPVVPLLRRRLRRACPAGHAGRVSAIVTVVEAVVRGARLALTRLGRDLRSAAFAAPGFVRSSAMAGSGSGGSATRSSTGAHATPTGGVHSHGGPVRGCHTDAAACRTSPALATSVIRVLYKDARWGFALRSARCRRAERLEILHLASLRFRARCRELRRALERLPALVARHATAP